MSAAAWPLGLAGFGAIFGSFIAALVVRWPQGRSVLRGRSACDACGRTLGPGELVPVMSHLLQSGRCRACGARIDPQHLGIELAGVAIGAIAGWVAPGWEGVAGAVFGWLLLALAALDVAAFWLPDRLTATLALAGLASGAAGLAPDLDDRVIGGLVGYGALAGIAWGYRAWRGREGMGGGDPKLMGAIGLWLGWRLLPAVLVIASLIGLGLALLGAVTGRGVGRDTAFPFGALLGLAAFAGWIAMIASGL